MRCVNQVRDQLRFDIPGYDSALDQRVHDAVRNALNLAARDIDTKAVEIKYEQGACAVIEDRGVRSVVLWDDKQKKTEAIPMVRINIDELEEKALPEFQQELDDIVLADDPILNSLQVLGYNLQDISLIAQTAPATMAAVGTVYVDGYEYDALEYQVERGQPDRILYAAEATGKTVTLDLPLIDQDTEPYVMQLVDRQFTRGEMVRLKVLREGDGQFIVVQGVDNYYTLIEVDQEESAVRRVLVVPGDQIEGRIGHDQVLENYDSPEPSDVGISNVTGYMEHMIDLIEDHGSYNDQMAVQIEYIPSQGVYAVTLEDGQRIPIAGEYEDDLDPVTLTKVMDSADAARLVGTRTFHKNGKIIHEIIHVQDGYALVAESKLSKTTGSYVARKSFVIPLLPLKDLDSKGISSL